jgi:hypothetical protein
MQRTKADITSQQKWNTSSGFHDVGNSCSNSKFSCTSKTAIQTFEDNILCSSRQTSDKKFLRIWQKNLNSSYACSHASKSNYWAKLHLELSSISNSLIFVLWISTSQASIGRIKDVERIRLNKSERTNYKIRKKKIDWRLSLCKRYKCTARRRF